MIWISTDDRLPEDGTYVLGHAPDQPWHDSDDQEGCKFVVVKFVRGITQEERAALPDDDPRKRQIRMGDEHANNKRGYEWNTFGSSKFFGQDVHRWMPILRDFEPRRLNG